MHEKIANSIVTVSGMVGGVAEVSMNNSSYMGMIVAASLSAVVGYGVKMLLDVVISIIKDRKN